MSTIKIIATALLMVVLTFFSWQQSVNGMGLSDDLSQTASVRAGSASGGRVLVGGGIHSGK